MNAIEIEKLINESINNDSDAFAQIYSYYARDVYYFALRILKNEDSANDVVQETMLILYNNLGKIRKPQALKSFIGTTTYNCCMMQLRAKKENLLEDDEIFTNIEETNEEFIPHKYLHNKELRQEVISAVNVLSSDQRMVIMMYYFEDLSSKDIAKTLNETDAVIRKRLSRARNNIKKALESSAVKGVAMVLVMTPILTEILKLDAKAAFFAGPNQTNWEALGKQLGYSPAQVTSGMKYVSASAHTVLPQASVVTTAAKSATLGKLFITGLLTAGVTVSGIVAYNQMTKPITTPNSDETYSDETYSDETYSDETYSDETYSSHTNEISENDLVGIKHMDETIYFPPIVSATNNDTLTYQQELPPALATENLENVDENTKTLEPGAVNNEKDQIIIQGNYLPIKYPVGSKILVQDVIDRAKISVKEGSTIKISYFDQIDSRIAGEYIVYFTATNEKSSETVATIILVGNLI